MLSATLILWSASTIFEPQFWAAWSWQANPGCCTWGWRHLVSSFLAHNTLFFLSFFVDSTVLYYTRKQPIWASLPPLHPKRNDILVSSQMYSFIHGFYVSLVFSELNSLVGYVCSLKSCQVRNPYISSCLQSWLIILVVRSVVHVFFCFFVLFVSFTKFWLNWSLAPTPNGTNFQFYFSYWWLSSFYRAILPVVNDL